MAFQRARNVQVEVDLFRSVQAVDLWGTIASLMGGSSAPAQQGPEDLAEQAMVEGVSQVLLDFCETYPVCRVAPTAAALEALWAQCAKFPPALVADALCEQLGWMSSTEWQGRLRALKALQHFRTQGARGRQIALAVSEQGAELLKALAEVPQCRDTAVPLILDLRLDAGRGADDDGFAADWDVAPSPPAAFVAGERLLVRTDDGTRWMDARVEAFFPEDTQTEGYLVPAGTVKVVYELGIKWVMPMHQAATLRPAPVMAPALPAAEGSVPARPQLGECTLRTHSLSGDCALDAPAFEPAMEPLPEAVPIKEAAGADKDEASEALTREPSDEIAGESARNSPRTAGEAAEGTSPKPALGPLLPEPSALTAPSPYIDALTTLGRKEVDAPASVHDLVAMLGSVPNVPKPEAEQKQGLELSGPANFSLALSLSGVQAL